MVGVRGGGGGQGGRGWWRSGGRGWWVVGVGVVGVRGVVE